MCVRHARPDFRFSNDVFAASMAFGFCARSTTESAIVRAATSIPFRPMLVPACAAACHECAEVPGAQVAAVNETVGTTQLTSPTSLDAGPDPSYRSAITVSGPGSFCALENVFWICSANRRSSAVYSYPPALRMLRPTTSLSASLGRMLA